MCKKLIYLIPFMLVLGLVSSASAEVLVHWTFDEGSGTTVFDASGNGRDGTFVGNPQWIQGKYGGALEFNGSTDYVIYNLPAAQNFANFTVALWVKASTLGQGQWMAPFSSHTPNSSGIQIDVDGTNPGNYRTNPPGGTGAPQFGPVTLEWIHLALVGRDTAVDYYYNGTLAATNNFTANQLLFNEFLVGNSRNNSNYFGGAVDDFRVLDEALSADDIQRMMLSQGVAGIPLARKPSPADGALYTDTWVNLSWKGGDFALSHDVYLGENFDDVNAGAESVFQGNQAGTSLIAGFPGFPYPDGLVPGTTYYWRVDEVNDAEPNSPWIGEIWSFSIPPKTAYDPIPADGVKFADPDVTLNWTGGFSARLHHVYFGDNFEDVNNATVGLPIADTTYTPGTLELDKVYYWRVDEFDGVVTPKGNVWSFRTMPDIPITDPNLVAWWTLDEGSGTAALDWSGHGNHGTFTNDPKWVNGYDGGALQFDGINDSVIYYLAAEETWSAYTVAVWARAGSLWQSNNSCLFANHMIFATDTPSFQFSFDAVNNYQYHGSIDQIMGPVTTAWVHLAATCDGPTTNLYYNGDLVASVSTGAINPVFTKFAIGINRAEDNWFEGTIDNLRIYDKVLTADEIQQAMRGDPLLAWGPKPNPGSIQYIRDATPLSWSPGDNASEHDVYFGTDEDAVADADESDTTGIYRGRQGATSYTPPEGVEWGGGPYFWRIDEYNTDATISKSSVWSFAVADFIGIDDFEDYNTGENQIWYAWKDGLGYGIPGTEPYYAGNGTGSAVGDETTSSYTEETIIHGGGKSMPLFYDNSVLRYSEVEMTLSYPRDWTEEGVGVLSLWFYGDASNAAESLYVALNGSAVVFHDNPNAVLIEEWTEWTIDLQTFADQGVNLANVNTIALGLGNKNPDVSGVAGGSGTVYFDDIRLYRPAPPPESAPEPTP